MAVLHPADKERATAFPYSAADTWPANRAPPVCMHMSPFGSGVHKGAREGEASIANDDVGRSTEGPIRQVGLAGSIVHRTGPLVHMVMSVPGQVHLHRPAMSS